MVDTFEEEKQRFLIELTEIQSLYGPFQYQDNILEKYSKELRSNKELVLLLLSVSRNTFVLKYISDELKHDKDFFLENIYHDIVSVYYAHDDLKKDKEFVLELFKLDIYTLEYADPILLNDEYFLWHIIKIYNITHDLRLMEIMEEIMDDRILDEIYNNPNFLEEFAPSVNYKPAKRN
jgi:hypothetical protein